MAIATGARLKEVVGLRWEDIDRQAGVMFLSEDNKTGTPRAVPLGKTAEAVLRGQVRHLRTPYVFVDESGESYASTRQRNRVSQRTKAAMKAAKVDGASFHTLRHTVGSWLGQAGFSDLQIGALLGHAWATRNVTGRYTHFQADGLRAMVSKLDDLVSSGPKSALSQTETS